MTEGQPTAGFDHLVDGCEHGLVDGERLSAFAVFRGEKRSLADRSPFPPISMAGTANLVIRGDVTHTELTNCRRAACLAYRHAASPMRAD